ncbi:anti-sigma factor antagonist [Streptomyces sp. NHF165]|nr:STAS domain-containing protein [Streptomyces cacaoi]QHF96920.1 anti-sigma factor antagonist [Streptomyces sp. NHF165]
MHITGDHAELVVGGCLDVRSAADARSALHAAVDGGDGDLVLDLAGLAAWDATGLGVIMGVHRRAGRCGRRLVLRRVPQQMQRLLVATRLHRILAIDHGAGHPPRPAAGAPPAGRPAPPDPGRATGVTGATAAQTAAEHDKMDSAVPPVPAEPARILTKP